MKTLADQRHNTLVAHFHVMNSKLFVNKYIGSTITAWEVEVLLAQNIKPPSLSVLAFEKITIL